MAEEVVQAQYLQPGDAIDHPVTGERVTVSKTRLIGQGEHRTGAVEAEPLEVLKRNAVEFESGEPVDFALDYPVRRYP